MEHGITHLFNRISEVMAGITEMEWGLIHQCQLCFAIESATKHFQGIQTVFKQQVL